MAAIVYEFGNFRLDPEERLLLRGQDLVPLAPKAVETLVALVSHHGQLIEKGDLIAAVWPDIFVEEGGLARNISLLRKTLGEDETTPYIETIPKRGYRFVAPVREVPKEVSGAFETAAASALPAPDAAGPSNRRSYSVIAGIAIFALVAAAWAWRAYSARSGSQPAAKSLLVLPLRNLSGDSAQDYFSDAITEAILTDLAKFSGLRVIRGRQRPEAGPLAAKYDRVVGGTVLRSGPRVTVFVQLEEARSREVLWAESYDREQREIPDLAATLAAQIAREVRVKLTGQEQKRLGHVRPVDPEAYNAWSQGRYLWNRRTERSLREAIRYFEQSLDRDPGYAPAWAGLADAYALLGSNGYDGMPPSEAMPRARDSAVKALGLDDTLADAHATLGYVRLVYDWNAPAAESEFRRSLELNSSYATARQWYGHYFLAMGEPEKAQAEMERAAELDPSSLVIRLGIAWCRYYARDYDGAIRRFEAILADDPGFAVAHQTLGMAFEEQHRYREAIAQIEKAADLTGGSASALAALGHAFAVSGQKAKAEAQLHLLAALAGQRYVPALCQAWIYLGLNDSERALQYLRKAREERSEYLIYFALAPGYDRIREDARFGFLNVFAPAKQVTPARESSAPLPGPVSTPATSRRPAP